MYFSTPKKTFLETFRWTNYPPTRNYLEDGVGPSLFHTFLDLHVHDLEPHVSAANINGCSLSNLKRVLSHSAKQLAKQVGWNMLEVFFPTNTNPTTNNSNSNNNNNKSFNKKMKEIIIWSSLSSIFAVRGPWLLVLPPEQAPSALLAPQTRHCQRSLQIPPPQKKKVDSPKSTVYTPWN